MKGKTQKKISSYFSAFLYQHRERLDTMTEKLMKKKMNVLHFPMRRIVHQMLEEKIRKKIPLFYFI